MTEKEKILFNLLKKEIANTFLKENAALSSDISQWKGDDIIKFQEDLLQKVKASVSEKWFYSYIRNDIEKLPRIDMLNLLSQYVGFENWADFRHKYHQNQTIEKTKKLSKKSLQIVIVLLFVSLLGIVGFSWQKNTNFYSIKFCLIDENNQPVNEVKVFWVLKDESEKPLNIDKNRCVHIKTDRKNIQLRIISPYYKNKIINRKVQNDIEENIILETDLYPQLIRHYSNNSNIDWKKSRKILNRFIDDDATIYQQWFGAEQGIEIFSKEEFIQQLSIPTRMLKHIEILEIAYKNGRVIKLRFKVNNTKTNLQ